MENTMKMATAVIAIALCMSSLLSLTYAGANINGYVTGKVVCNPCSKKGKGGAPIKSAQMMIICFDKKTNAGTYARKGITNDVGVYKIAMKPGIEKDDCEVRLHKNSPLPDCREIVPGKNVTKVDFSTPVGTSNNKPLYSAAKVIGYKTKGSRCH
ncbi:hypothetical protein LWI28_026710 [Acer negundo]|uniref:Uncharacterized protein n=1 Tax=Acer negundo TaxID=4023 RepID=A0AAD5J8K2_ACENE|nr:hypothetical protein LWI28_026710 [Acer negundo]